MTSQPRKAAGRPDGGEYGTKPRAEADVSITPSTGSSLKQRNIEATRVLMQQSGIPQSEIVDAFTAMSEATGKGVSVDDWRQRSAMLREITEAKMAGVTEADLEATGSGYDWARAAECKEAGLDPQLAAQWAPLNQRRIFALDAAGYKPSDNGSQLTEPEMLKASDWALHSISPDDRKEWEEAGFGVETAGYYADAEWGVGDAVRLQACNPDPQPTSLAVHLPQALNSYGVTIDEVENAIEAGLAPFPENTIWHGEPYEKDFAEVIFNMEPETIREWAGAFGGEPIEANVINGWDQALDIHDPHEAAEWQRAVDKASQQWGIGHWSNPRLQALTSRLSPADLSSDLHPFAQIAGVDLGLGPEKISELSKTLTEADEPSTAIRNVYSKFGVEPPF